jgi:hypothetical protein
MADTPVVARVEEDQVVFDPRTVMHAEETVLLDVLRSQLQAHYA